MPVHSTQVSSKLALHAIVIPSVQLSDSVLQRTTFTMGATVLLPSVYFRLTIFFLT